MFFFGVTCRAKNFSFKLRIEPKDLTEIKPLGLNLVASFYTILKSDTVNRYFDSEKLSLADDFK